jgi:acyl dehydratase
MIVPGDTITVWAKVKEKRKVDGLGFVYMDVGMRIQEDTETCPGTATIVLPIQGGREIPYPFVPPEGA